MGTYLPNSASEQKAMLDFLGLKSLDDFFSHLPKEVMLNRELNIPEGKCEVEVKRQMEEMAGKNKIFRTIFRGAGAYKHYIPALVKSVSSKETFVTAYTPYQPEISQGVLQSIFEFQTMICELTGMDGSNASVYDGATACAEAVAMCLDRKRSVAYVSATVHPDYLRSVQTYCYAANRGLVVIPEKDGVTDIEFLRNIIKDDSACFIMQQPNFYGLIEDADALGKVAKGAGTKFVISMNPFFAAIGKTPREYGADIAVGEGQPLGIPLGFGGPYLGFMASTREMARTLPGRISGQTLDVDGNRAFVLTMQAREQHIRREKAVSSICSNQALCAIAAGVYMATMGPSGMKEVARQSLSKAHYAAKQISSIPGFELALKGEFFHEFVTKCPCCPDKVMAKLEEKGILGGHILKGKHENHILWCCTEANTKAEIDELVATLKEVC
jgi:glycine dehydrogenase subunit 1